MRLGVLGPAEEDLDALERAARFLLEDRAVDRVLYLGLDGAMDRVVTRWAEALVDADPQESALWTRALRCLHASPLSIDLFVARERERQALRILESLPGQGSRVIEILDGKLAVLLHSKDDLDEEDMLPAAFLVFGSSRDPVVKQVGSRWFLSPGELESAGVMELEDREDGVYLTLFDDTGRECRHDRLATAHVARMRVEGG